MWTEMSIDGSFITFYCDILEERMEPMSGTIEDDVITVEVSGV